MRRLILVLAAACVIAAPTAGAAAAKNGNGAMCVLHARLAAENDTGSTSTATGQTLIQVRENGMIEFKTEINNRDGAGAVVHPGRVHMHPLAGHPTNPREIRPEPICPR
jgi:diaminopimelate epimerase